MTVVIADAVLRYLTNQPPRLEYRFIELDRATTPVDALAAKLARYHALAHHRTSGRTEPAWRRHYATLPSVLVVMAGASRNRLERRARTVIALYRSIAGTHDVAASFCLLDDLDTRGPFAPVFTPIDDPERRVDWLGHDAPR